MSDLLLEPVPNTEAAAFLKKKPALASAVFDRLVPEVKARAFAVSGIECAKTLQSLRDRIADLPLGGDWSAIKRDIVNQISPFLAKGEDAEKDAAAAERRAELILRTHGYQAYAAAQFQTMDAQRDVFPFWRYQTAQDDSVREAHRALDGVVIPCNDDFWKTHFPPWDFNCRCTVVPLSRADAEEIAADDAGKPAPERSILTEDQLSGMNRGGYLNRGPATNVDVRSPRDRGRPDGYAWQPGDLRLSAEDLRKRYEPAVWGAFEELAKRTGLDPADGAGTLWDWLNGDAPASAAPAPALPIEAPTAQKPRQSPVSRALEVKARGETGKAVKEAVALIDRAHDDGALPKIPVLGSTGSGPNTHGVYVYQLTGKALRIGVAGHARQKLMTAAHEIGHCIDHQALGASGRYASENSPLLAAWRKTVADSAPIKAIRDKLAVEKNPKLREHWDYMLSEREIFARSYAQWIATRTGDAAMLAELAAMRAWPGYGPLAQWSHEEFAPIAAELETVFRQKGWI